MSFGSALDTIVHAGGRSVSGPSDVPVGRLAVAEDAFGNPLVLLDMSKGRYVTDDSGRVTGVVGAGSNGPPPADDFCASEKS